MIKISIITACFNAEKTIADCLKSVNSQTHPDIEHIIIDGASTDSTMLILKKHCDASTKIISEPDEGIYFALNKGIAMATGDVIGFLHADDVFNDDFVLRSVASTFETTLTAACYADLLYVKQDQTNIIVREWKSSPYTKGMFRRGWMPPHPTFYATRSTYASFGSFDTSLNIGADWDLLVRFMEIHDISSFYVPEVWIRMRLGGTSNRSIQNIVRNNWETWNRFREHFGFLPSLLFPPLKWIHRLKQFKHS